MAGSNGKKIIFLHVPKAGGTTLTDVIVRNYPSEKIYTLAGTRQAMIDFMELPADKINSYDCVQGHMGFGFHRLFESKVRYLTLLRDHVNRLISFIYS